MSLTVVSTDERYPLFRLNPHGPERSRYHCSEKLKCFSKTARAVYGNGTPSPPEYVGLTGSTNDRQKTEKPNSVTGQTLRSGGGGGGGGAGRTHVRAVESL